MRIICSLVMSSAPAAGLVLRVLDISRAHPHCEIKRLVYVRLPLEDPRSQEAGFCGVLNMALYGMRDAGQNFELTTTETLTQAGIEQGIFTPCVYKWKEKKACLFHHGDDFVVAASRSGGDAVVEVLRTKFIVKDRGTLGPGHGDLKEVTILNRLIRWCGSWTVGGERLEFEADPRHVQILQAQLGLRPGSRGIGTPGLSEAVTDISEQALDDEQAALFRSACMRLGYVALDRPEIQFAAKECARGMSCPTQRHLSLLKRAARFTLIAPRTIWVWRRQAPVKTLLLQCDTDWAGCKLTRRSTSAVVVLAGQHCVLTASTTQIPIALSSGEAEFYGVTRAASRAIGLVALYNDFGVTVDARVATDSSAALGIAQRRGCGKVRHLETPTLWVQRALKLGRFGLVKIAGKINCADLGTKHVDATTMRGHLNRMDLVLVESAHETALRAKV